MCRGTDVSKCFSESLGIRDNESRLYLYFHSYTPLKKIRIKSFQQDISKTIQARVLKFDIVIGNDV